MGCTEIASAFRRGSDGPREWRNGNGRVHGGANCETPWCGKGDRHRTQRRRIGTDPRARSRRDAALTRRRRSAERSLQRAVRVRCRRRARLFVGLERRAPVECRGTSATPSASLRANRGCQFRDPDATCPRATALFDRNARMQRLECCPERNCVLHRRTYQRSTCRKFRDRRERLST
jgi:hypothetical protein